MPEASVDWDCDAKADDRTFALNRSPMRFLPLTVAQATKVNAALRLGTDPARWISPRQAKLLVSIEALLKRDAHALDGLERPEQTAALTAYAHKLEARIAKAQDDGE